MLMPSLDITINQDHDDIEVKQVLTEANAYRTTLSYPKQSNFRVIAVLVYQDAVDRNVHHLLGANCEPCHIAGKKKWSRPSPSHSFNCDALRIYA